MRLAFGAVSERGQGDMTELMGLPAVNDEDV